MYRNAPLPAEEVLFILCGSSACLSTDVFCFGEPVWGVQAEADPRSHLSGFALSAAPADLLVSADSNSPLAAPPGPPPDDRDFFPRFFPGTRSDDRYRGADGPDVIIGLRGADRLSGQGGDDWLDGGRSADVLRAGSGEDFLIGGSGGDVLRGDNGRDYLFGGAGDDILYGGRGSDFYFLESRVGRDVIRDFSGSDYVVVIRSYGDFAEVRRRDVEIVDRGGFDRLYIDDEVVARIEGDLSRSELIFV